VVLIRPFATLEIHTIYKAAILWFLSNVAEFHIVLNDEVKGKLVDSDLVSTRVVLQSCSQESLREEESRDPEYYWSSLFIPVVKERNTGVEIFNPRGEWFH
jgi:hypothetical protein